MSETTDFRNVSPLEAQLNAALTAALRREEVLREALKSLTECFEVWSTLPDPTEWPIKPTYGLLVTVRKAINALSACDEGRK